MPKSPKSTVQSSADAPPLDAAAKIHELVKEHPEDLMRLSSMLWLLLINAAGNSRSEVLQGAVGATYECLTSPPSNRHAGIAAYAMFRALVDAGDVDEPPPFVTRWLLDARRPFHRDPRRESELRSLYVLAMRQWLLAKQDFLTYCAEAPDAEIQALRRPGNSRISELEREHLELLTDRREFERMRLVFGHGLENEIAEWQRLFAGYVFSRAAQTDLHWDDPVFVDALTGEPLVTQPFAPDALPSPSDMAHHVGFLRGFAAPANVRERAVSGLWFTCRRLLLWLGNFAAVDRWAPKYGRVLTGIPAPPRQCHGCGREGYRKIPTARRTVATWSMASFRA